MSRKPAVTSVPIDSTIAERWSGRAYDASKPVTHEQTIALLEAARWAPSCYGDQPWRFIVWDKNKDAAAWQKAFETLVEFNQGWVKDAPLLVLIAADTKFHHNGKPNPFAAYDSGAAAENLCLQATALGLQAHQMAGFDSDKLRAAFSVPEQIQIQALIAVGSPADPATLEGDIKERELAPRTRRELGELFFDSAWGKPIV
ncbi:nitroreductase family protein [Methylobacillus gramineus]|uniref:nitroreductase family protein n=1 Tax=Methylobacillus gramineus TaxID=755169 RepID=UPI001D000CCB|nr:nitroreductase family protein [Methylobacillus gramineus]MCB5184675.1 nitroreductase family protein [Methylobacillus gramineus]